MVKKLKTKLDIKSLFSFLNISAKTLPVLAVFLFLTFFVNINLVKAAENIDPSTVQVKTELLINGKADNLVRNYTGGTTQFSVILTVTQAKNKIASNLGSISLGSDLLDFDVSGNFDRTITQFGAGVGKSNNDNCSAQTVSAFIGSNKVFAECAFVSSQALSSGKVEVGKQYTFNFSLDSAALNSLALTSPCPRNAQTTACFTAWPYLYLSKVGIDRKLAIIGASKDVYVQIFPDKAAMDAAVAANQRPSDIPVYGSNTGGAEIGGGGNRMAALINEIIGVLIGFLQELVYGIFYWLIAPLIQAMLSIHVYTDTFVAVIYPGWEVIRNICNIFFIVALMVIALATLFRVDSYQTRPLLIQLILAALMINFSLVIAQAILALADTIQAQFLPANVTVIRSLAGDLMVGTYRDLYGTKAFADASFAGIIKPLFFLAMSLGSFMVFAAIAVFLLIRIVALWLLLLISPIAYAVGVLPSTAQYRKTWWDNFLKYAFFTPIMAFFLNLTAVISNQFKDIPILQSVSDPRLVNELGNSDIAGFVFKVASNVLLLVFLLAALKVADMAGIYGASGITSIAQKGFFAPFIGAKYLTKDMAGGYLQKRYNNATAKLAEGGPGIKGILKKGLYAGLHIPSTVKSFRKDSSEELERSKDLTSAATLSIKRQVPYFQRRGEDPLALYNEHKGKELLEERRGESTDTEEDEVVFGMQLVEEAMGGKDKDAMLMLPEQLRRMTKNHNINEFVERFGIKYFGANDKKREFKYKKENLIGMLKKIQDMGGMSEHVNVDLQKRLGKFGYESGDHTASELTYNEHGHAKAIDVEFDEKKKSFVVVGQDLFERIHEEAQNSSTNQEEYEAKITESVKNLSQEDKKAYDNAQKNFSKIRENRVNLSKKDDLGQMKQWWESVVSTEVNEQGEATPVLGLSGGYLATHFGTGHEFLATRGNPSTKILELFLPLVKNSAQLKKELRKAIKQEAFAKGKRIDNIELEIKKQQYHNLRIAALAEKDADINSIKAFDLVVTDPDDSTKKVTIKPDDSRYEDLLDKRINEITKILKEDESGLKKGSDEDEDGV